MQVCPQRGRIVAVKFSSFSEVPPYPYIRKSKSREY